MTNWIYTWYSPRGQLKPLEIGNAFADLALHSVLIHPRPTATSPNGRRRR
jgi:hypothetical protein